MEDKKLNDIKIGVIGGDLRQLYAAEFLAEEGFEVALYGINPPAEIGFPESVTRCTSYRDAISGSSLITLPLPCTIDGIRVNCPLGDYNIKIDDIFSYITCNQIITGGRIEQLLHEKAQIYDINLIDYYEREELCIANTVPTSEGAIAIAMEVMPITIHGSKAIIYGYGRVGKVLANTAKALGASVTIAARSREAFAWAKTSGFEICDISKKPEGNFDIVFNTVPSLVLTEEILSSFKAGTPIIELASKPGGIDMKAAADLRLKPIWALSLPGRVAPATAGKSIAEAIINIFNEHKGDSQSIN